MTGVQTCALPILNSKLIEQLKVYYTKWKQLSHIKETLSFSAEVRKPLSLIIHDPLRSTRAPAIPQNQLTLHHATKGFLDIPATQSWSSTPSNKIKSITDSESVASQAILAIPSPDVPMEVDIHLPLASSVTDPGVVGCGTVPPSAIPSHDN